MERIILIGAEDVRSAGSAMQSAAHDMKSAASTIDHSFEANRRFMDDWLQRFEAAVEKLQPPQISSNYKPEITLPKRNDDDENGF